tara:strand:- start:2 stop:277 length:276 start_codon:yes stop_codon:yes gene_type:complete
LNSPILTADQAAKWFGCTAIHIRELAKEGVIPATKIGGRWIFHQHLLDDFVRQQTLDTNKKDKPKNKNGDAFLRDIMEANGMNEGKNPQKS